jgi:hypothetical protein
MYASARILLIDEQLGVEFAIVQLDGNIGTGQAFVEDIDRAVGVADSQGALADGASKQTGQQARVSVLRGRRKSRYTMYPKEVTPCRTIKVINRPASQ